MADGTFWEDERNKNYVDVKKSAHNILLEKIKQADKKIAGDDNPVARRLLLLTLLIKYLEDRGVFATENNFFSKYVNGANTFFDVLKDGTIGSIEKLLKYLEERFNGDIFILKRKNGERLTQSMIQQIVNVIRPDIDEKGQLYFWDMYNFAYIPIEVISHIYQYFTEKGQGAVFTPVLLVNLMIDQVMPLEFIKGNEKIFDPTCGSGIFLVSAFRRLVYVYQRKEKGKVTPWKLVALLKKTIYGIELQEEAAYITSFSLALAVCDALRPDIIWKELKFEKLIEKNIFIGDFGKRGNDVLKVNKLGTGFDIILGNPPFKSELTQSMKDDLNTTGLAIPDQQMAYYVLKKCTEKYLSYGNKLCMIQPYGFLYNNKTADIRASFFAENKVVKVLDFISVSGLFYDADTKAIVIQLSKKKPENVHKLSHLTFRRTIATNERICFELDHYDYHTVLQRQAADKKFSWKANLLGGGRLNQLDKRLREDFDSIRIFLKKKKWVVNEGFIIGNGKNDGTFLEGKPLLTPEAFMKFGLDKRLFKTVNTKAIERPRREIIYHPPLLVMHKKDALNLAFWNEGFLAYRHNFVGIKSPEQQKEELAFFWKAFMNNKEKTLKPILILLGSQTLAGRATAALSNDIMNLPWPEDGNYNLIPWEKELLDDIRIYMAEYIRKGQGSALLQKTAIKGDFENYAQTFLRLMKIPYPDMKLIKCSKSDNLAFIAFSFSDSVDSFPELNNPDWEKNLNSIILKEQNDILQTQRILRIFTGNILIIVKPNKLRYWIRSTAIRDVDDVIVDIFKGGK